MTKQKAADLLTPFINECTNCGDPYFVVHFSVDDDYFSGFENKLDFLDATIIMEQLVKQFPQLKIYFHEPITA